MLVYPLEFKRGLVYSYYHGNVGRKATKLTVLKTVFLTYICKSYRSLRLK